MNKNRNININEEADEPGKITIFFVLLISLILVGMDFVSLYYSYNYLIESINTTTTVLSAKLGSKNSYKIIPRVCLTT